MTKAGSCYSISLSDESMLYSQFQYPAGEWQVRFSQSESEEIRKATDEIRVTARIGSSDDIIKLALLSDAIRGLNRSAFRRLILPYLPYGRADRRFQDGDCFGLSTFASIINTMGYDHVVTLDGHSDEGSRLINKLTDVSPRQLIERAIWRIKTSGTLTILYPDEGASKRYDLPSEFSGDMGYVKLQFLHCSKKREPQTGKLSGFRVPSLREFESTDVLIVDDICDGGGTFLGIADQLGSYGIDLSLYVTHGIFSKGITDLRNKFSSIYTSDSIYSGGPEVTVFSCGNLLAKHIG